MTSSTGVAEPAVGCGMLAIMRYDPVAKLLWGRNDDKALLCEAARSGILRDANIICRYLRIPSLNPLCQL